jgi:hypothetical protein
LSTPLGQHAATPASSCKQAITLKCPAQRHDECNDSITVSAPVPRVDFDGANQPKLGEKGAEHVDYRL